MVPLAVAVFFLSLGPCTGEVWEGPARVVGRVVDPKTGAGIGGVRVELRGEGRFVTADPDGRFEFTDVARGRHVLVAVPEGFLPSAPREVDVGDEPEIAVEIPCTLAIETEVRGAPARLLEMPLPVAGTATLDARQIETNVGGLEDVYRALQTSPGVAASQDNRNDLLVRGGGAIENETRVDGFTMPTVAHIGAQGGSGGGLSILPPWLVGQATLEAGGFSVAYGERASSVIGLTLRSGNGERFAGAVGAGVGGAMGLAEGPLLAGRGTWLVSARKSFLELVFGQADVRAVPRYADALARVELWVSPHHQLEVLGLGGQDNVVANSGQNGQQRLTDDQSVGMAGIALRSEWGPRMTSRIAASYGLNAYDATLTDRGATDFRDRSREVELRLRAELARRLWAGTELLAGAAVKKAYLSFELSEDRYRNEFGNLVPAVRTNGHVDFADEAVYAEVAWPEVAAFKATTGLRVDRSGTTGLFYTSPRIRADYQVAPSVRLTGAWGVYRQSIPYIWIGSHPANARLDPVWSRQIVAGAEVGSLGGARVLLGAFDKRYRGYPVDPAAPSRVLISAATDFESPFVGRLEPAGLVRARGVDAAVTRSFGRVFATSVVYSYLRSTQLGLDRVWRPADFDIRHHGRIDLRYTRLDRWLVSASWRYATGRPYTPFDAVASIRAGGGRYDTARINGENYPPYHRLDVRVDYVRRFRPARLTLYAEIDNLYDRDNIYLYEWSSSARQAEPLYQWGRTPVAGVRVDF